MDKRIRYLTNAGLQYSIGYSIFTRDVYGIDSITYSIYYYYYCIVFLFSLMNK